MSCCKNWGFRRERHYDRFDPYDPFYRHERKDLHRHYRYRNLYRDGYLSCPSRKCGYYDYRKYYK
ncbi:hypothetical protein DFR55_10396 [Herbinix hemicellulosilytica]|uniref:Uncharacterized protein n=1 Tax=Herbinix hemicellulosilytica TaxID=1564487 RepID=A0A0H5SG98_HERHM|nr:hypothetical protein [Herbinix hemicellulosilytica]RBP60112.1 hypothetical protein DFR55_10396 [Herbinix hemicellulosilytica]CRZ33836.1 hypothetical protein HHT355_0632 [Herbinix hemicellulosilytica]